MPAHLAIALLLGALTPADAPAPARTASVTLPQSFVEEDGGFGMYGAGLSARLEPGRMHWIVEDATAGRRVVTVAFAGSVAGVVPVGERRRPGVVSRFRGPPEAWRAGLRTFGAVRYDGLWPGVDLLLEAERDTLKGTWRLAPGADPAVLRLRHVGADDVALAGDGSLVLRTAAGDVVDAPPVAWQEIGGVRREVPVSFAVAPAGDDAWDVTFEVGAYDPEVVLLVDPAVVVQAGFLGGAQDDVPWDIAVGDDGCLYIAGSTLSDEATFPLAVGPELTYDGAPAPGGDAYVAKLDPTGTTLLYAGFLGGTEYDYIYGIAVDALGRAYVGGTTRSDDGPDGFPVTVGPDVTYNGSEEGFVARVSADGSALEYCGYIGGNSADRIFDVDVDGSGRMVVVGRFQSLPATLPLINGPYLAEGGGSTDGFVARVSADGVGLEYCGYLAGDDLEDITEVVVDDAGGAWFAGYSWSSDFPTVGPLGPVANGSIQAVVGRVAPDGTSLTSCGFVGGAASEYPGDIALDDAGSVHVAGLTYDAFTYPALGGPNLTPIGPTDGFVTKLAPDGNSIVWSGFTNTGGSDEIDVDGDGTVWMLGTPDGSDAFLARVPPDGAGIETVLALPMPGGTTLWAPAAVPAAVTPGGREIWIAGWSTDDETTFPVVTGPDVTANGMTDTVVLKVRVDDGPWTDLGFALAGTNGSPLLEGTGTLAPSTPLTLELTSARGSASAWLVFGLSTIFAPFKGGVLVPSPSPPGIVIPLVTSPAGTLVLPATWPAGVPAGFSIYAQFWIDDPAGPNGFAASNGLSGTTP